MLSYESEGRILAHGQWLSVFVKQTLERLMVDDLTEHLQAQWNQRTVTRRDYRNGYRERSLLTKQGELELKVRRACGQLSKMFILLPVINSAGYINFAMFPKYQKL